MGKLVKCKSCGNEVAKGAKSCPGCGKDNRSFFRKHKILTGIGIIIIIGVIGSKMGSSDKPKLASDAGSTTTTTDSKSNQPQTFKVGDTVELKNLKITVNKVYDVESTNQFAQPQDGNKFVATDITIENTSNQQQAVSSMMMFKVVDKDGRACEYSLIGQTAANAGQLDGTIESGRKLTGVYVVEVPKDKTGLELEFDSSIILGNKVIVTLN